MLLRRFFFSILLNILIISACFAQVGQISDDQLRQMMVQKTVLVDIRRPEEWRQTGVIKDSHLLTFFDKKGNYNTKKWLAELDKIIKKDQAFVLICRTGSRTGMVSSFLDRKLNYKNVNNLTKGITSWIRKGNEVVKP